MAAKQHKIVSKSSSNGNGNRLEELNESEHIIEMTLDKECKGSCRYTAADSEAVVNNVYLSRSIGKMPKRITVTVAV